MRQLTVTVHVVSDAELKSTKSDGQPYVYMRVGSNEYKGKNGNEDTYDTCYYRVVSFNKRDIILVKYYKKGRSLIIEGDYSDSLYTSQTDGNTYISREIVASRIWFNGDRKSSGQTYNSDKQNEIKYKPRNVEVEMQRDIDITSIEDTDDLPF